MMKKRVILFSFVILLIFSFPVFGENLVRVATLSENSPICFFKENKSGHHEVIPPGKDSDFFTGFGFEILRDSYHSMGYSIELHVVPWKRAIYMVDTAMADIIFPAVRTKKREERYYFSKELSYTSNRYVFFIKNRELNFRTNVLESLKGKIIGTMVGYSYGKKWEEYMGNNFFNVWKVKSLNQGFELLSNNRIDAHLCFELQCDYYLKNSEFKGKFIKLPSIGSTRSYLMGLKSEETRKFLDIFDKGKENIRKKGILNKIYKDWGVNKKE